MKNSQGEDIFSKLLLSQHKDSAVRTRPPLSKSSEGSLNPLQTTTEPQDSLDSGFQWLYNQPMPPAFWARLESMTNLMRYSIYNF